ncbi:MAG: hypothetical protein ACE5JF_10265 [Anaerolineales bacterium]
MLLQISLWAGIVALYLGIAVAVGIFSRQAIIEERAGRDRLVAASYSIALFLPATALVLAMVVSSLRIMLIAFAMAALLAAYTQPSWIPEFIWQRTFTHRYLAGVMAIAALWGIMQAQGGSSMAPLLITISAVAAAAASSGVTLRTPSIDIK